VYVSKPNLIIGFHGCEKEDQNRLLNDIKYFKNSHEDYDWLGHGMYFWENNPFSDLHNQSELYQGFVFTKRV
jgi:hypothetical protein